MRIGLRMLALVGAVGLAAASCGGGDGAGSSATIGPTGAGSGSAATRIEVTLTDTLTIEPEAFSVPVDVPVTFVVTNAGASDHEFYVGDEAAQAEHAREMLEMGGMVHDDPNGIGVEPGTTKEWTYTFEETGETFAGCHVAGHYAGGMRALIDVSG